MADVIRKATNKFTKGLVMDFSPENTRNEVLTHALNATLLTFNGNELSLQNDMGNARVETAYLPDGYMPVGTCEYGGIIYIVSYNPLEDKSQIGCFPSPERNISNKELGIQNVKINSEDFQTYGTDGILTGDIKSTSKYVLLKNDNLNPGDKFMICSDHNIYSAKLHNLLIKAQGETEFKPVENPMLALNVVSIEDSGKIVYLNSDLRRYEATNTYTLEDGSELTDTYNYHIVGTMAADASGNYDPNSVDPDTYRNVLQSGYNVFKSKTSGRLAILAELITIDSYSVTHSLQPREDDENYFDVVLHTEVEPALTLDNYTTAPKLQYYYLQHSQGYMQAVDNTGSTKIPLYIETPEGEVTNTRNSAIDTIGLDEIYTETYKNSINLNQMFGAFGKINFPPLGTYHGNMHAIDNPDEVKGDADKKVYTKFEEGKYYRIDSSQLDMNALEEYYINKLRATFYKYSQSTTEYTEWQYNYVNNQYTYYIPTTKESYHDAKRDQQYGLGFLYELTTSLQPAPSTVVEDKTIEKFKQGEVEKYTLATQEDFDSNCRLFIKDGDVYQERFRPIDPNLTYYIRETEWNWVSLGTDIKQEDYEGVVYYYPTTKEYKLASEDLVKEYFDFETYPMAPDAPYGSPITLYYREEEKSYRPATETEILQYIEEGHKLYYNQDYVPLSFNEVRDFRGGADFDEYQLFIVLPEDTFLSSDRFEFNQDYNCLDVNGVIMRPTYVVDNVTTYVKPVYKDITEYPKDHGLTLYIVQDFIPAPPDNNSSSTYEDVRLGSIKIPATLTDNGLDLPFKYDYTIVPCMIYGKLPHLAVSNTVDFSKLHAFNQSNYTTWKYRIDGSQLRLTFGAAVYDTYETYKVNGLILEFYDHLGFAGSLEISDKKSYSGEFTKIIQLNSLSALSSKKIVEGEYKSGYSRNINIQEIDGVLKLHGKTVAYYPDLGYVYFDKGETEPVEDNDCGTLYSNMLYGVKTYLKRETDSGTQFIRTKDFFLYTLPIYNDYYYTTNDFSQLENPELDVVLTYKIKDTGSRLTYNAEGFSQGYETGDPSDPSKYKDKEHVSEYLAGYYKQPNLQLTKFYKYVGTGDLQLEIGLRKEYEELNISYDKDINKCFTCKLLLTNDEGTGTYKLNSTSTTITSPELILNYKEGMSLDSNKLGFGETYESTVDIKVPTKDDEQGFEQYNFISSNGGNSVKINYEFLVGYQALISEIRATQIPATTICALYHKDANDAYNCEDFGIYQQVNTTQSEEPQFLSDKMFYNGGTKDMEVFGLCKQIKTSGSNMLDECQSITSVESAAQEITTAGKLNAGDPLKQLVTQIGKLSFCQPHAHGLSEENGVNIHEGNGTVKQYGIPPEKGGWSIDHDAGSSDKEKCFGSNPRMYLFNHPRYNLSLNTKNSILYNSEFISTLDWKLITNQMYGYHLGESDREWYTVVMREYTGFTGEEIATFNKKLLKTMSSIYAYNPDYDSLFVNVGEVSLQDYYPYFTSNILSHSASLDFGSKTFNDFVYINGINFSTYLTKMRNNSGDDNTCLIIRESDGSLKKQLEFIPGLDYCGNGDNHYLVSQLSYNAALPTDLTQELQFTASGNLVVKHSDGSTTQIKGTPNKKALYGFDHNTNKLIQLDVSNYIIEEDGSLELQGVTNKLHKLDLSEYSFQQLLNGVDVDIPDPQDENVTIKAKFKLTYFNQGESGDSVRVKLIKQDGTKAYFEVQRDTPHDKNKTATADDPRYTWTFASNEGLQIFPTFELSDENDIYGLYSDSITFQCQGRLLNQAIYKFDSGNSYGSLASQSINTLNTLLGPLGTNPSVSITCKDGNTRSWNLNTHWGYNQEEQHQIWLSGQKMNQNSDITKEPETLSFVISADLVNESKDTSKVIQQKVELYCIDFKSLTFYITKEVELAQDERTIIPTNRTGRYASIIDSRYKVLNQYSKSQIRGTSLTLNDLIYEPEANGHRLFVRNNLCVYDSNWYRSKLYYRKWSDSANGDSTWHYNYKYYNSLFLFTGPCFTKDNL